MINPTRKKSGAVVILDTSGSTMPSKSDRQRKAMREIIKSIVSYRI